MKIQMFTFVKKNMFSTGQLVFAGIFAISFIIFIVISYRKDLVIHKLHYKGSIWILMFFMLFILLLFAIKYIFKE